MAEVEDEAPRQRRKIGNALLATSAGLDVLENIFVGVFGLGGGLHSRLCLDGVILGGDGDGGVGLGSGARRVTGDGKWLWRVIGIFCANWKEKWV